MIKEPNKAFILHRRPYRETSFLLELFTEEFGRIGVIAKGAKRTKSPFRYVLEPFVLLSVNWQGKGDLPTFRMAESIGKAFYLKGKRLFSAFYVNELLMRLLHRHDPHPKIFQNYSILLNQLNELKSDDFKFIEVVLRTFEKKLLDELGYGLQLKTEGYSQNLIQENQYYRFVPGEGFMIHDKSTNVSPVLLFQGKNLLAIAQHDFSSDSVLKDAKRLMRLVFDYLLEGRDIESRRLFSDRF